MISLLHEGADGIRDDGLRGRQENTQGETRSYAWVAREIGKPKAARAVGSALNRNPFAPEVPCHRVIRSDGSIGGFAQGTEQKREMLKREGAL